MNMSEDARSLKIAQGRKALEHLRSLKRNQNANGGDGDHDPLIVLPSPFMSRVSRPRERPRSIPANWLSSRNPVINLDPSQTAKSVSGDTKQIGKTVLSDCTNTPASFHDQPSEPTSSSSAGTEEVILGTNEEEAIQDLPDEPSVESESLAVENDTETHENSDQTSAIAAAEAAPSENRLEPRENSEQPPAPDAVISEV
jgi:hypothetical protein